MNLLGAVAKNVTASCRVGMAPLSKREPVILAHIRSVRDDFEAETCSPEDE